jgi:hypothetical protein
VVTTNQPHPNNWRIESASAVVPSAVADGIRTAQAHGWTPEKPGSPFHLDRSEGFVPSSY